MTPCLLFFSVCSRDPTQALMLAQQALGTLRRFPPSVLQFWNSCRLGKSLRLSHMKGPNNSSQYTFQVLVNTLVEVVLEEVAPQSSFSKL